jgi:hypothetical protein
VDFISPPNLVLAGQEGRRVEAAEELRRVEEPATEQIMRDTACGSRRSPYLDL